MLNSEWMTGSISKLHMQSLNFDTVNIRLSLKYWSCLWKSVYKGYANGSILHTYSVTLDHTYPKVWILTQRHHRM